MITLYSGDPTQVRINPTRLSDNENEPSDIYATSVKLSNAGIYVVEHVNECVTFVSTFNSTRTDLDIVK